ncbi:MAG TPA: LysE family translocator [Actinomycetes bacterium]|jgi:threonine/homoserine/homoserine lactone efflux protein|nr:LysE family translocator [Actinomycetes bacterium]
MIPLDRLLPFAAVALVLLVIPGPSVLFVIGRAVALGRRAGLATAAGNEAGGYLQVAALALGIGAIVERSLRVFTALKLLGACYIVYLGVRAVRERQALARALDAAIVPRRTRRIVLDGFVVGVTNPKSAVFFAAVLPQFVAPAAGHVPLQLLALGLVFVANRLPLVELAAPVGAARFNHARRQLPPTATMATQQVRRSQEA